MTDPDILRILDALNASYSAQTSSIQDEWVADNPSLGHCVPASLVVQDYIGGDLGRCRIRIGDKSEMHYFNILSDGTVLDATIRQYQGRGEREMSPVDLRGYKSVRDKRLSDPVTRDRYVLLKSRVVAFLGDR